MSDGLPGYDAWKLATPPEYENDDPCEHCGTREADETIRDHRDRPMRLCRECADEWDREQLSEEEEAATSAASAHEVRPQGLPTGGSPGCAGGDCGKDGGGRNET